jgi:hypothetical protein
MCIEENGNLSQTRKGMRASLNKKYIKNSTKLKQIARLHRLLVMNQCE